MKYDQHTHTHRGKKAHWLGTKARFGKLDAVCRDRLKVPVDWPEVTAVFTDWSKMKIAETLSMAGDRGAYLTGLTDVSEPTKKIFIRLFKVLGRMVAKALSEQEIIEVHDELMLVLATLEVKLPLYWNHITTHLLIHAGAQFKDLGAFWAQNMLMFERYHVLLKQLARGSRNMMRSLGKNYDIYEQCQTTWRFEGQWSSSPRKSTMASHREVQLNEGEVTLPKAKRPGRLNDEGLFLVGALWATVNKGFDKMRDRYVAYRGKQNKTRKAILSMRRWKPRGNALSEQEKLWKQMTRNVAVIYTYNLFI